MIISALLNFFYIVIAKSFHLLGLFPKIEVLWVNLIPSGGIFNHAWW